MGCSLKSEGTVRTDSLSTSIRELVDGDSVMSTWEEQERASGWCVSSKELKGHLSRAWRSFIDRHGGKVATYLLRSLFGSLGCSCCVRHVC